MFRIFNLTGKKPIRKLRKLSILFVNVLDSPDYCLLEVLQYITNELTGGEFNDFVERLGISRGDKTKVDSIKNVSWKILKCYLERLGRLDIVDHIHQSTLITEGILYTFQKRQAFMFLYK